MNKDKICYVLRKHYPEFIGIRRNLQKIKVRRICRYMLSKEEILLCEENADYKTCIVKKYIKSRYKFLMSSIYEMENIFKNAPLYKNRTDKEKLKYDMLFCRLAYGFIPSEYVGFALENKTPQERKTYVSDIDTNIFGYSVNNIVDVQTFIDKGDAYNYLSEYYKREILVVDKKTTYDSFRSFVQKNNPFVEKKVFSSMGKDVKLIELLNDEIEWNNYFQKLKRIGKFVLEEVIQQDDRLAIFNKSSVNTVRIITFRTKGNKIIIPYAFLKTGREGSFVDNAGSGGVLSGIEPKTGKIFTDGFDEFGGKYEMHPDSKKQFKEFKIPKWKDVANLAKECALNIDDMAYLSWDFALTNHGWDIVEVNEVGQFIVPQIVMEKGIKDELNVYKLLMNSVI